MIQSRGQFGFYGAVLVLRRVDRPGLRVPLPRSSVIQGQAMHLLVGTISIPGWIGIASVPVIALTIYGYEWIHRWQRLAHRDPLG